MKKTNDIECLCSGCRRARKREQWAEDNIGRPLSNLLLIVVGVLFVVFLCGFFADMFGWGDGFFFPQGRPE